MDHDSRPLSSNRHVFFYAIAGLGIEMSWASLAGYLPPLLERLAATPLIIGIMMSTGPLSGLIIQPLIGLFSDRINTPLGRRLPFLIIFAPLTAIAFFAIAYVKDLIIAVPLLLLLCCAINGYQGSYRAMLGEEFVSHRQAFASSIQNLFGGIGMLLTFTVGAFFLRYHDGGPFLFNGLMVLLSTTITIFGFIFEKHNRRPVKVDETISESFWAYLKKEKSLQWLFAAQFCWWFAIQGVIAFAVLYAVHDLEHINDIASPAGKVASARAVLLLAIVTVTVLISAVPFALLAERFGKKLILTIGLILLMIAFLLCGLAQNIDQTFYVMILFGLGFATIQIMPFLILAELQPAGKEGIAAGVYNLFIAAPQLLSVIIVGQLSGMFGHYRIAFYVGMIFLFFATILLQNVKLIREASLKK